DEELLSDVHPGTAHDAIAAVGLAAHGIALRLADDRTVPGEAILDPERPGLLAELEVCLGDGPAGIEHAHDVIEVFGGLRVWVAADEPTSVHGEALPRAELQHKPRARPALGDDAGRLDVLELVLGVTEAPRRLGSARLLSLGEQCRGCHGISLELRGLDDRGVPRAAEVLARRASDIATLATE